MHRSTFARGREEVIRVAAVGDYADVGMFAVMSGLVVLVTILLMTALTAAG